LINLIVYEKVKTHDKWLRDFNADTHNRNGSTGVTLLQFEGDLDRHYIVFEFSGTGIMTSLTLTSRRLSRRCSKMLISWSRRFNSAPKRSRVINASRS
jgi:hypothetical protein